MRRKTTYFGALDHLSCSMVGWQELYPLIFFPPLSLAVQNTASHLLGMLGIIKECTPYRGLILHWPLSLRILR